MFDADHPITKIKHDRLGRAIFARYLARCIVDHTDKASLVTALYGGSGSGKTSIINMVSEELKNASNNIVGGEKPIVLHFDPWVYSGQNQLIYSFFRLLSSTIQDVPTLENNAAIAYLLELYASFFTHQPIPKLYLLKQKVFNLFLKTELGKQNLYGWKSGRYLADIKAELNQFMRQQPHKLIIMIDNISLLRPVEINQIFQIVKSMADFSNTFYLLAMDKTQVIRALDKMHGEEGHELLDKIVQLPFELMPISQQNLENIFIDRMKNVIKLVPEGAWNNEYWADLYYSSLKYFFTSCRDITQYVNILGFNYPRVRDIVNPADFFAIKALANFEPAIFQGVRNNKDLFTDLVNHVYPSDKKRIAEDKLRCDEILARAEHVSKEIILQLLLRLFPRLQHVYQPHGVFVHSETLARKNHRICSPDIFEVYFRLSVPVDYISESEMNAILSMTHHEKEFAMILLRLNQDERVTKFLDLLDSLDAHKIAVDHIENVINALMDSADLFPEGEVGALSFDTPTRIHRIFYQLLSRIHDPEKRFRLFQNAVKRSNKSLYSIVHELTLLSNELTNQETMEHALFTAEMIQELKMEAAKKIAYWADLGRLGEHPKLLPILYAWLNWGDEIDCKRYVGKLTQDDRGLVQFLCAALRDPIDQAMTKLIKSNDWKSSLKHIESFISPVILQPHAKMLFEEIGFEKMREREQLAILIFLDLTKVETNKVMPHLL